MIMIVVVALVCDLFAFPNDIFVSIPCSLQLSVWKKMMGHLVLWVSLVICVQVGDLITSYHRALHSFLTIYEYFDAFIFFSDFVGEGS
ncbi:putative methyltransferase, chloroplastic isoform X1 [Iris pallida]|uniref:Methyltransferase, chloroplastic isoform X1 n=1 Tax=Iris pallida TaxID=29817 RepID=A0AAX6H9U6_IRIPA|nr:putative methyltransferase, chloroplastic isoform X1 [Iris pallida]